MAARFNFPAQFIKPFLLLKLAAAGGASWLLAGNPESPVRVKNWGTSARADPDICAVRVQTSAKVRLTATIGRLVQSVMRIAPATAVLAGGASAPGSLPQEKSGMILRANGAKIKRTASGQQGPIGLLHAAVQQANFLERISCGKSQAIATISERPKPNR